MDEDWQFKFQPGKQAITFLLIGESGNGSDLGPTQRRHSKTPVRAPIRLRTITPKRTAHEDTLQGIMDDITIAEQDRQGSSKQQTQLFSFPIFYSRIQWITPFGSVWKPKPVLKLTNLWNH
uniref:Uncharacterized protein n=1 Tax=Acrobeloides nanus TaxID=290746 RepID=A0A914CHQ3_9BILA